MSRIRRTRQREAIERAFRDADGPLSPQEIQVRATAEVSTLSVAPSSFVVTGHDLMLTGICDGCLR